MKISIEIEGDEFDSLKGEIVYACKEKIIADIGAKIVREFQADYSPETTKRLEEVASKIAENRVRTLEARMDSIVWGEMYKKVKDDIKDAIRKVSGE